MKNDKGITMVALVITVIVMAILSGIAISSGSKILKEAELQDAVTNMLLIQAKVKIAIEEVNFKTINLDETKVQGKIDEIKQVLVGDKLKEEDYNEYIPTEIQNNITNGSYYLISDDELKKMGLYELTNINDENNYYIYIIKDIDSGNGVEYKLEDIFYTGGYIHSDKKIYYTLSELINLQNS